MIQIASGQYMIITRLQAYPEVAQGLFICTLILFKESKKRFNFWYQVDYRLFAAFFTINIYIKPDFSQYNYYFYLIRVK